MEEEKERGDGRKVGGLIDRATNSTEAEVDPRLLRAIKSLVRSSDSELHLAADTLFDLMKRHHSQVRYLALLIIDELFMRSKLFRALVVEKLDQLLALSVGFRGHSPLPAPPSVASRLRSIAIEFLEKWHASFGIHYRQLRLGFDHLKNTLRLQFPDIQGNAARAQEERRKREMRTREILQKKFAKLKSKSSSIKEEIQSTVDEIVECLDIVSTEEEVLVPLDDDEDFDEFRSLELRQIRLDSLKEGEKVHENNDNKVVFDTLRELYKLLVTKHLASVQEWISVLVRVEVTDNRFRDSALKEFIDIKNRLASVKKKCEESGCSLANAKPREEEDNFWEEDKMEILENGTSSALNKQNAGLSKASTSESGVNETRCSKKKSTECSKRKMASTDPESTSLKSKLLAEAPVVKWGAYLDNWGSHGDALANHRGLEVEGHWGRVDNDAVIPAEKIAELNVHASVYKEEQNEIPPCRAPLRKGELCQRRDLRVCPFHGPIVPRNEEGNPIYQNSTPNEMPRELDAGLVQQLANDAIKNVRDRDKEEVKKRQIDQKSLKRAKLAKVREHNAAVLRDAALASTSRSEAAYANAERQSAGNKKQTLASMLRKKVTRKGRLAQKLLNARVKEATVRQLRLGEDTNYREAFPNQW